MATGFFSLLWSVISIVLWCIKLLCIVPFFGLGLFRTIVEKALHDLSGSSTEFGYFSDDENDHYTYDSISDTWETYRCMGIIMLLTLFMLIVYLVQNDCKCESKLFITPAHSLYSRWTSFQLLVIQPRALQSHAGQQRHR